MSKKEDKIALFIGRFQPFHKGHLFALEQILKRYKKVVIGIGSSQESKTYQNPFSAFERISFIKKCLKKNWIKKIKFVKIKDVKDDNEWIKNIKKRFFPKKYDVCTQNKLVIKLAKKESYKVYKPKFLKRKVLQAKNIRKNLLLKRRINKFVQIKIKKEIEEKWKEIEKNLKKKVNF